MRARAAHAAKVSAAVGFTLALSLALWLAAAFVVFGGWTGPIARGLLHGD